MWWGPAELSRVQGQVAAEHAARHCSSASSLQREALVALQCASQPRQIYYLLASVALAPITQLVTCACQTLCTLHVEWCLLCPLPDTNQCAKPQCIWEGGKSSTAVTTKGGLEGKVTSGSLRLVMPVISVWCCGFILPLGQGPGSAELRRKGRTITSFYADCLFPSCADLLSCPGHMQNLWRLFRPPWPLLPCTAQGWTDPRLSHEDAHLCHLNLGQLATKW